MIGKRVCGNLCRQSRYTAGAGIAVLGHGLIQALSLRIDPAAGERTYKGRDQPNGKTCYDYMGNRPEKIAIGEDGRGEFFVEGGSISAWVEE